MSDHDGWGHREAGRSFITLFRCRSTFKHFLMIFIEKWIFQNNDTEIVSILPLKYGSCGRDVFYVVGRRSVLLDSNKSSFPSRLVQSLAFHLA